MKVQYKKILRDMAADWLKSLLLILAIAVSVFGVGTIFGALTILNREMDRNYSETNPAHATIVVEGTIPSDTVQRVRKMPGVTLAEREAVITARMHVQGEWRRLLLFVADDFSRVQINRFKHLSGPQTPAIGTTLVERGTLTWINSSLGENIEVKLPDGRPIRLQMTGVVHDPGLAPSRQEQTGYAYINPETLRLLGGADLDQLRLRTSGQTMEEVQSIASRVSLSLVDEGYQIHEIQIPPFERHPHFTQMNAILALLAVFACLLLLLSSMLTKSAVSVIMSRQVREIGVMKTIGASTGRIAGLYFFLLFCISATGTLIGLIPTVPLAGILSGRIGDLLNFTIYDPIPPHPVMVVQVLVGLAMPILIASSSVLYGSRVSIREAISDYGVSAENLSQSLLGRIARLAPFLGTLGSMVLRNLTRNRSRLAVTLLLLGLAGAVFTTAWNIARSWDTNLNRVLSERNYDLEIRFSRPVETADLKEKLLKIPGVVQVEGWTRVPTSFLVPGEFAVSHVYPDKGHGSFDLIGKPDDARIPNLKIRAGRWFAADDTESVVLNHAAVARKPNLKIGDDVALSVDGSLRTFRLSGIVEENFAFQSAYVSSSALAQAIGAAETKSKANTLRIAFQPCEKACMDEKTREVEGLLEQENAPVVVALSTGTFKNAVSEHMGVLVGVLLAAGGLMGVVGLLGLMSTISMNILDRTRELGVMRAVGAAPRTILRLLLLEGLWIGLVSLVLAAVLSLPLSWGLGWWIGNMSFQMPLILTLSLPGIAGWIVLLIVGSLAATFPPSWKASRMPVREALAYE